MKKTNEIPLWTQENPSICRFCANATRLEELKEIYCRKKKKNFDEGNTCKKFVYDVLKKELRRGRSQTLKYDPKEFEI